MKNSDGQVLPDIGPTPPEEGPPKRQRRKSSDQRIADIIDAAADHFAEVGFGGGTRDIAKRVGVTQPLLYRYFPDKDSLIEAVYRNVYLESWNADWDAKLLDRTLPVHARFDKFYHAYITENFNPRWLRIAYFAGLRDAQINQWYNHLIEELILKPLVREHRVELGMADDAYVCEQELETAWQMHGGLLHYGWRRHVLNLPTPESISDVISGALDMYFAVAPNVYDRAARSNTDMGQ